MDVICAVRIARVFRALIIKLLKLDAEQVEEWCGFSEGTQKPEFGDWRTRLVWIMLNLSALVRGLWDLQSRVPRIQSVAQCYSRSQNICAVDVLNLHSIVPDHSSLNAEASYLTSNVSLFSTVQRSLVIFS